MLPLFFSKFLWVAKYVWATPLLINIPFHTCLGLLAGMQVSNILEHIWGRINHLPRSKEIFHCRLPVQSVVATCSICVLQKGRSDFGIPCTLWRLSGCHIACGGSKSNATGRRMVFMFSFWKIGLTDSICILLLITELYKFGDKWK